MGKGWLTNGLVVALLSLASAQALYLACHIGTANLLSARARWTQDNWARQPTLKPTQGEVDQVRDAYLAALAWRPHDGQLHASLGAVYSLQAARFSPSPDARRAALQQALAAFRAAVESRPMHQHGWLGIAYTLLQLNEVGPELWQAYDQAFRYGWREPTLRPQLVDICLSQWEAAGPERQLQLDQMLATLHGEQRKELLDNAIYWGHYHQLTTR